MLFTPIIVIALSVASFSPLVFGDPAAVVNLFNPKVRVFPNDYIDRVKIEFTNRKNKNSLITLKFLVKKTFPDTAQLKVNVTYNGVMLVDYSTDVCEGLVEPTIGKGIAKVGLPKGEFPQQCPLGPGDLTVLNWEPPTKLLPTLPDGTATGSVMLVNAGEPWYVLDFDATLKNRFPALGR